MGCICVTDQQPPTMEEGTEDMGTGDVLMKLREGYREQPHVL